VLGKVNFLSRLKRRGAATNGLSKASFLPDGRQVRLQEIPLSLPLSKGDKKARLKPCPTK